MQYSQSPPLADNDADPADAHRAFARDQEARSEPRFGRRAGPAPVYAVAPPRRSIGRRMFGSLARFVILVSIGVGATLGWQAYGDVAKQMLAAGAPEQAWLLSYLPGTKPPAAVAAAASPALQLEPLAANLDAMRRSFEQLAVRQDQMARSIVALQATNEDIRQKMSSQPPAPAPANAMAAVPPPPKPAAPKLQPPPGAPRASASGAPVPIAPRSSAQ
ncbi:MAG: hypothetical protein GY844_35955 [Bradyrhizobium sp.]|nr:hypothetical protein [Bradyrhizobium sp.]